MHQSNNDEPPDDSTPQLNKPRARKRDYLRKLLQAAERPVQEGFLHGASSKLGSGAVSLIILWIQTRH
ncbi:hypothetical protein ACFWG5_34780 [Streptomyces hydrogenans]|uniref:hypothetical protein n=1 Tax=Streptomyces TaxID=1883 RepID=UPI003624C390